MIVRETSFAATYPELIQELDMDRNDFDPYELPRKGGTTTMWWKCSFGHSYETRGAHPRIRGAGCPYCSGQRLVTEKSLASLFPEIAEEWHLDRNDIGPDEISAGSQLNIGGNVPMDMNGMRCLAIEPNLVQDAHIAEVKGLNHRPLNVGF
jgi:hypothetical protein